MSFGKTEITTKRDGLHSLWKPTSAGQDRAGGKIGGASIRAARGSLSSLRRLVLLQLIGQRSGSPKAGSYLRRP